MVPRMLVLITQSCLTLCSPMDCSLSGSSVHGILQARMLEWVSIPFSRRSSQPRDQTQVSCIAAKFFTVWATREAPFLAIRKYYWKFPVLLSVLVLLFWKLSPTPTPTLSLWGGADWLCRLVLCMHVLVCGNPTRSHLLMCKHFADKPWAKQCLCS